MKQPFIGMGEGPNGIELPLGLSMELTARPKAAATFGSMNEAQKREAIGYIQGGVSGADAKRRIETVVKQMEEGKRELT